ncbi:thiamine pyrophosphate-binding protein [Sesbania bispinosa]|nr:thiamine pyrophosphate-binding protein [Sesbania bispinosa]
MVLHIRPPCTFSFLVALWGNGEFYMVGAVLPVGLRRQKQNVGQEMGAINPRICKMKEM